ncbi:MAG: hypothetical protein ACREDS_13200 [Limisphaerales bacterium]
MNSKKIYFYLGLIYWFFVLSVNAQDATNSSPSNDLGRMTSKQRFQQLMFTTPAYRHEALRLVIGEANRVATELDLAESLPIVKSNLVSTYIPSPGMARRLGGALGNITTSNYTYYISVANKFSFLEMRGMKKAYSQLRSQYLWPISRMDTNAAYQLATQFLAAASMNVKAITRDCDVHIDAFMPEGSNGKYFVPVYGVHWTSKNHAVRGSVAEVKFIEPTKTLCQLRVSRPEYILRKPLIITNLDYLLSQTNTPPARIY